MMTLTDKDLYQLIHMDVTEADPKARYTQLKPANERMTKFLCGAMRGIDPDDIGIAGTGENAHVYAEWVDKDTHMTVAFRFYEDDALIHISTDNEKIYHSMSFDPVSAKKIVFLFLPPPTRYVQ